MENDLVQLYVVGITYNQIENGMYALVLEEQEGKHRRLPIIVGYNEAQSIECVLQNIPTPRPLTHSLTAAIMGAFGVRITSVVIRILPNGIFAADMTLVKGKKEIILDARSSDAIALAMRMKAPIFANRELMDQCGVEKDSFSPASNHIVSNSTIPLRQAVERVKHTSSESLRTISDEDLRTWMQLAVENEDYEKAGEIKNELEKRHKKK